MRPKVLPVAPARICGCSPCTMYIAVYAATYEKVPLLLVHTVTGHIFFSRPNSKRKAHTFALDATIVHGYWSAKQSLTVQADKVQMQDDN